jgi:hypothetical protein
MTEAPTGTAQQRRGDSRRTRTRSSVHLHGRTASVPRQPGRSPRLRSRLRTLSCADPRRRCSHAAADDTTRCTTVRRSVPPSVSARSKRGLLGTRRCSPVLWARLAPAATPANIRKPAVSREGSAQAPAVSRNSAGGCRKFPSSTDRSSEGTDTHGAATSSSRSASGPPKLTVLFDEPLVASRMIRAATSPASTLCTTKPSGIGRISGVRARTVRIASIHEWN